MCVCVCVCVCVICDGLVSLSTDISCCFLCFLMLGLITLTMRVGEHFNISQEIILCQTDVEEDYCAEGKDSNVT